MRYGHAQLLAVSRMGAKQHTMANKGARRSPATAARRRNNALPTSLHTVIAAIANCRANCCTWQEKLQTRACTTTANKNIKRDKLCITPGLDTQKQNLCAYRPSAVVRRLLMRILSKSCSISAMSVALWQPPTQAHARASAFHALYAVSSAGGPMGRRPSDNKL